MPTAVDVAIVGRGPAGLLLSALLVRQNLSVAVIADAQGSQSLWGGQWDFRNYSETGHVILNPYAWWLKAGETAALRDCGVWQTRWDHLAQWWTELGLVNTPRAPALNRWTMTPLGHLRPTFLAPRWQWVSDHPVSVALIGLPGVVDFAASSMAAVYERTTGYGAMVRMVGEPPGWQTHWTPLHWAAYLDTLQGRQWLKRELCGLQPVGDRPALFPQVLGIQHPEEIIAEASAALGGNPVSEIPLMPPAVGGIRVQRREDEWLKRHGVRYISATTTAVEPGAVILTGGERVRCAHVVLATGGVLGGGFRVNVSGLVTDAITGQTVGHMDADHDDQPGYVTWDAGVPVVGRMIRGWNPDHHGNGGALNLWTVHEVYRTLTSKMGSVLTT